MVKQEGQQARRAEQEGAPRLPHRGHLRGRPGPPGHRGEVAARRVARPWSTGSPRSTTTRCGCTACTSRSTPRAPGPTTPPAASASCCSTAPRSTRSSAGSTSKGLTDRAAVAVLQGRPRQGRDRPRQGQEVLRQAARARRAAGRTARRSRRSAVGSRAATLAEPLRDADVPGWWAAARAARAVRRARALPAAAGAWPRCASSSTPPAR